MRGSKLCYFHNPHIPDEEKRQARAKGGQSNKIIIQSALPAIPLREVRDVVALLEDTTNRVRSGEVDIKIANTLGFLAGHLIKALELAQLEGRVEEIERVILERRTNRV